MTNLNQVKIVVIGDVHDQWGMEDHKALETLGVDLALFVGDFGNESVQIVSLIANLALPKAVILGNHDAWYTASSGGRKKSPYNHQVEDRVTQQLTLLGDTHVGYGKLDFPQFNLSVVGGRPFSWGGNNWRNKKFLCERFGVNNFHESVDLILENAQTTLSENIIILGHNGPTGLGDQPEDPCGKDWQPLGGDHGDPDLETAIAKVKQLGKNIPLVTFGHMHHRLRHTHIRERTKVKKMEETVYFNSACAPRISKINEQVIRQFSLVTLINKQVTKINSVWLNSSYEIVKEDLIYQHNYV